MPLLLLWTLASGAVFAQQQYTIHTLAPGLGFAHGITRDVSGDTYVANGQGTIHRLTAGGGNVIVAGVAGSSGSTSDGVPALSARFNSPIGVAAGRGRIYVVDYLNHRIRSFTEGGLVLGAAGSGVAGFQDGFAPLARFNFPTHAAFDSQDRLYISEIAGQRIRRINFAPPGFDLSDTVSTYAGNGQLGFSGDGGPALNARLNNPQQIAFDANDNLYIADLSNHCIRVVDRTTQIIRTFAGTCGVRGFSGDGGPATSARMNEPLGVAVDSSGRVFIAEHQTHVIRVVENGIIRTIAGTPNTAGLSGDGGPALNARLSGPWNLLVDPQGNVLITDRFNERVRILRPISDCTITLSPTSSATAGPGGGTGNANFLGTPFGCAWTASSNAPWLRIQGASTGAGNGSVFYAVDPNPGGASRTGMLTINNAAFAVTQQGSSCPTVLSPGNAIFSSSATEGQFTVTSNCAWTAVPSAAFVTVTAPPGGAGNGTATVRFTLQPNTTGSARSASIAAGDQVFLITQNATALCTYALSAPSATVLAGGGQGSFQVATQGGCAWSATESADWLRIVSGANGSVNGTVAFAASGNTGPERSAVVSVAGQSFTVRQLAGTGCPTTLTPPGATFNAGGGTAASVEINTPCIWTASSNSGFLTISGNNAGNGNGRITFNVAPATAARNGSLTIGGVPFPVSQRAPECRYSVSSILQSAPASGGLVEFAVNTNSGCSWSITPDPAASWLQIVAGAGSGTGSGIARLTASSNTGSARTAFLRIQDIPVSVRQQSGQDLSCAAGALPASVRAEGQTELAAAITVVCSGEVPDGQLWRADILVTTNVNLTSQPDGAATEALLVAGTPATLVPGVNAFRGVAAGNDAVLFTSVPLETLTLAGADRARAPRTWVFSIRNLRVDASALESGEDIRARVDVRGAAVCLLSEPPQCFTPPFASTSSATIARRRQAFQATLGAPQAAASDAVLTATFTELVPDAFRIRIAANQDPSPLTGSFASESGYVNTAVLGPTVGVATSGTRMLVKLRGVPAGVRVFANVSPSAGQGAQLTAQDSNGAGVGLLTGQSQEITITDGAATVAWEILAANPTVLESLAFQIRFAGMSVADAQAIRNQSRAVIGPTGAVVQSSRPQPLPRFRDAAEGARSRVNLQVGSTVLLTGSDRRAPLRRDTTGSRSFSIDTTVTCEAAGGCPEPVIRGNLSQGSSFTGACTSEDGVAGCSTNDRDATVQYSSLSQGQSVRAVLAAELRDNAPLGSLLSLRLSGSSDLTTAVSVVERCFASTGSLPQASAGTTSGDFQIFACGPWAIQSSQPWISFEPASGTGNATVRYTISANGTGVGRTATITIPGFPSFTVLQTGGQEPSGLRFVPVAPCRVADTRPGEGKTGAFGPPVLTAFATRDLPIPQSGCGIPAGARAYSVNITVVPDGGGLQYLTAWPAGQPRPLASSLNSFDGKIVANAAILPAGANGAISVFVTDRTHVIVDINGYFVP